MAVACYMEMRDNAIDLAWIFNINQTVGENIQIRRPDVMLVQHALNTVMAALRLRDETGKFITYLRRDGYCGPRTGTAIRAYQRNLIERGFLVVADGFVEPSSRSGWTRRGDAQYTIVYLNRDHLKIHGKMMDEPDFPHELQFDIKANAFRK